MRTPLYPKLGYVALSAAPSANASKYNYLAFWVCEDKDNADNHTSSEIALESGSGLDRGFLSGGSIPTKKMY